MELVVRRWRRQLWSSVPAGRILDIGVGTRQNVPCYPAGADVVATDVSRRVFDRARRRLLAARVGLSLTDAQALAFPDTTFDAAVATFVFFSVPDPVLGLTEARRVPKAGDRCTSSSTCGATPPPRPPHRPCQPSLRAVDGGEPEPAHRRERVRRAGFRVVEEHGLMPGPGRRVFKRIVAERE